MLYQTYHDRMTGRDVLMTGPDPYGQRFALILPAQFDPLTALECVRDWYDDCDLTTAPAEWFENRVIELAKQWDSWCEGK